ncbi:MAG: TIGR00730 family Rossman fold protein [Desulfosalsimonadaceae bacterium]|nr:TIGR00730 family Rossman fold protein [Desulfosalsimonadaceae bacterium]
MKLNFKENNGPVDAIIDELIRQAGDIGRPRIVREMILSALKAGQEDDAGSDLKMMNTSLKEMRYTAKIFGDYRPFKKVTVFGSARTRPDEKAYQMARQMGEKLAQAGYMVITGGGPGIMQAVHEGAGPEKSFGVNIRLPFEQQSNPVVNGNPKNIHYKYFFNRKVAFLKESDAVVLFPGGFGTHDEGMETLTLVQTGKRNPLPLILVDEPGGTYWSGWVRFLKAHLLTSGYIGESDLHLMERVEDVDEAVAKIDRFYFRYHSLRYIGDQVVLRLTSAIDQDRVNALKASFSEMLTPGGNMCLSGPLPREADEPELAHLPRLVVDFNRQNFGLLKQLIDAVNKAVRD